MARARLPLLSASKVCEICRRPSLLLHIPSPELDGKLTMLSSARCLLLNCRCPGLDMVEAAISRIPPP